MSSLAIPSTRRWADLVAPALDTAAIVVSFAAIKWITVGYVDEAALMAALSASIIFLLAGKITTLSRTSEIGNENQEVVSLCVTWGVTVLVLALLGFLTRQSAEFSRFNVLMWVFLAPSIVGLGRMCLRIIQQGFLRRGFGVRRVAIAGQNELGLQVAQNIYEDPSLGLRLSGFYEDRSASRCPDFPEDAPEEFFRKGNWAALVQDAREGNVDTILVTLPMRAEQRIRTLLESLSDSTASVYIVPDFFVFEMLHSRWTNLGGLPAVSVFENPLYGIDGVYKRISDLLISTFALIVLSPVLLAVAIAVKLSSRGPVFFRQKRYGLDGREILVWKFRSMKTCDNGPVVKQATKDDPRITRVGGILRKTSLDELPQLLNVLEGSMSLVGPRPHASAHNEQYRSVIRGYMLRHKVRPGITGLAQVNGCRGETETVEKMERRVRWDHRYIRTWSPWLDLKILVKTMLIAWRQDEAY